MLTRQRVLAACLAAVGVLQVAAAAPAAAAATLTTDALRAIEDAAVADAGAVDAAVLRAEADADDDDELESGPPELDDYENYFIKIKVPGSPMYVSGGIGDDDDWRDGSSNYVFMESVVTIESVFMAITTYERDVYKFEWVDPFSGVSRYLTAFKDHRGDVTKEGRFRVIVHEDRYKAAEWRLTPGPSGALNLVLWNHPDHDYNLEQVVLTVPHSDADRYGGTRYLTLSGDYDEAVEVQFEDVYGL